MQASYRDFFEAATTRQPYDYQRRLATEMCADGPKSLAINVPTGAGATAVCPVNRQEYGH
jgi:reverse gyrase